MWIHLVEMTAARQNRDTWRLYPGSTGPSAVSVVHRSVLSQPSCRRGPFGMLDADLEVNPIDIGASHGTSRR